MALTGIRVVELAGLAPGPFAGLVLADYGADVVRVDRPTGQPSDVLCRGKRSIALDLKRADGRLVLKGMIDKADVLIDPYRPGVMEKMGLGPEVFLGVGSNTRLIYARLVGFPRTGPQKVMAGHDINYLALSGVLSMLPGTSEKPTFPLNLLADFAGGGLLCALGVALALHERNRTGHGQVIDTDMVSGVRYLSSFPLIQHSEGSSYFSGERGSNILDGGAPFYDVYTCSDGKWVSVGCIEPQFFAAFITGLKEAVPARFSVDSGWVPEPESQIDHDNWPLVRAYIQAAFKTNTRDFWADVFHGTDACVVPVLAPDEAEKPDGSDSPIPKPHPTVASQPVPRARASGLQTELAAGRDTDEVLLEYGFEREEINELRRKGAIGEKSKL